MTAAPPDRDIARKRWRLSALSVVIAAICLLGVSVALYPSTASWFSSVQEAKQIAQYGDDVKVIGPASRIQALTQAAAYNAALDSGAEVKANERIPVDTGARLPAGFDYPKLLAANAYGLMARLVIPSIGVDLPIYHGTSDTTLEDGIGHLEGTSLPVGGPGTHAVLAGHRGLASATLFTNLDKVVNGDTFTVYVFGETLTYKIFSIKVVNPDETKSLNPVPGKDLITLVTCTPIGINSQRILVTAERVTPTPASAVAGADKSPVGPGLPWWALGFAAAAVGATAYIWWSGRPPRPRRKKSGAHHRAEKTARGKTRLPATAQELPNV